MKRLCLVADAGSIHTQRWAAEFARRGLEVVILSLRPGHVPGVSTRVVGVAWAKGYLAYLAALPRVRALLRQCKPDVLHAHYAGGYGLLAALSGYRPLVVTAWGSDVLLVPQRSRILGWLIGKVLRAADLVTSMAPHMTAVIRRFGVSDRRLITLPFGADTDVFRARRAEPADRGESRRQLIVSTRHLEPVYDVGTLIRAMPRILASAPLAKAIVIGAGSQRSELADLVNKLGIGGSVEFSGRLDPRAVASILALADVFVSTALSDGNNISLNEAMACGAFPVVTDIPANREWIENGSTGAVFAPRDSSGLAQRVIAALADPGWRAAAAVENRRTVERRGSWAASMSVMEQHYEALCGERVLNRELGRDRPEQTSFQPVLGPMNHPPRQDDRQERLPVLLAPVSATDVRDVADLHAAAFPDSLLTRFGETVVEGYYRAQFLGPAFKHACGAFLGKRLVGLSLVVTRTDLRRFLFLGAWDIAKRIVSQPALLLNRRLPRRAVACAKAMLFPPAADPNTLRILVICVAPSAQSLGIGRALLAETERFARSGKVLGLSLTVHPANARAVAFYEDSGWSRAPQGDVWLGAMKKVLDSGAPGPFSAGGASLIG